MIKSFKYFLQSILIYIFFILGRLLGIILVERYILLFSLFLAQNLNQKKLLKKI